MDQPAPQITAADVERLARRDFRPEEFSAAWAALESYGKKDWHRESFRVRAAMLKLANGRLEELQRALGIADQDYRDVLSAAEYPRYGREIDPAEKNKAKQQAVIADDWKHYRDWLERNASDPPPSP